MFKPKAWWEIYEVLAPDMDQDKAVDLANTIYNHLARKSMIKKAAMVRID